MGKKEYFSLIVCMAIGALLNAGCNGISNSSKEMNADSVAINKVALTDTAYFPLTNGGKCDIVADIKISYPDAYLNTESTKKLQELFAQVVLESSDSIEFKKSFQGFMNDVLRQYGASENENPEDVEDDYESVYQYANNTIITPIYNKNKVLSFCKSEITKKNGKQTMSTHKYYNFDLSTMKQIEYSDIFIDASADEIAGLIKTELIKQAKVTTEDELINLGYFNLDNLRPGNNFYIGKDGITWTFLPYEIALLSVGETNVTVSYSDLEVYLQDNDLIARIK